MSSIVSEVLPVNINASPAEQANIDVAPVDNAGHAHDATPGSQAEKANPEEVLQKHRDGIRKLALAGAELVDYKSKLKEYCAYGKKVFNHAQWQRSLVKNYEAADFKRLCTEVEGEMRLLAAVSNKEFRVAVFVRTYLWTEAVKTLHPDAMSLSYHLVCNIMLPTLSFSESNLTARIPDVWAEWVKQTVEKQLSDDPDSLADVRASYKQYKKDIADAKLAKKSPEAVLEAERKAALAARSSAESKARNDLSNALSQAMSKDGGTTTLVEPKSIVGLIEHIARESGVDLPPSGAAKSERSPFQIVLDAAKTMTGPEAVLLVKALEDSGNTVAMTLMYARLRKTVKNARAADEQNQAAFV
jgi:hypothetical protein